VRYHPLLDGAVTGGAALAVVALELANWKAGGAPCHWCDRHADGSDALNGFDAGVRARVRWQNIGRAQLLSNITVFGLLPAGTLWSWVAPDADFSTHARLEEVDLMAESMDLALLLGQGAKFSARRERPFVHALPAEQRGRTDKPWDNNPSFFSSHSAFSFALASSATTLAHLRHSRWTWAVAAGSYAAATLVAYLRVAGDKHYATDVLVGASVGSLIGIAVPVLHRTQTGSAGGSADGSAGSLSLSHVSSESGWSLAWSQSF